MKTNPSIPFSLFPANLDTTSLQVISLAIKSAPRNFKVVFNGKGIRVSEINPNFLETLNKAISN